MPRTTHSARVVVLGLLLALGLGACSSDDADTASSGGTTASDDGAFAPDAAFDGDDAGADAASAPREPGLGGTNLTGVDPASLGRQIIRTAAVDLVVADVEQSAAQVTALAGRLGGFISDAEVRGGTEDSAGWAVLTLRVPTASLDSAIGDLRALAAEVQSVRLGSDDVTDTYADIEARVTNLKALEVELVALLAEVRQRTQSASELLVIFNQVQEVRGEIESLEGRRASLDDRIALATITVNVVEDPDDLPDDEQSTFEEAVRATRDGFGAIGDVLVWFAVTVLPLGLATLGPVLLVVWAVLRVRGRRGEPGRHAPVPPPTVPSPPDAPAESD